LLFIPFFIYVHDMHIVVVSSICCFFIPHLRFFFTQRYKCSEGLDVIGGKTNHYRALTMAVNRELAKVIGEFANISGKLNEVVIFSF